MTCGNIIHFTVRTSYMRGYSISSYCICSIGYSIVGYIGYNSLNTRTSLQIKCSLVINRYFVTYTNNHKSSNSIASKYQSGNHNKKRMILQKTKVYRKIIVFYPKLENEQLYLQLHLHFFTKIRVGRTCVSSLICLFAKLSWPGKRIRTFRLSIQAATRFSHKTGEFLQIVLSPHRSRQQWCSPKKYLGWGQKISYVIFFTVYYYRP